MTVTPNPARLYGSGPDKLIILGGWFGCAAHWTAFLECLDPARWSVAAFDYRGYGSRRDVPGRYDFGEAAQDVVSMVVSLDWHDVTVIGHSMSGILMAHAAALAEERFARLFGFAPVAPQGSRLPDDRLDVFRAAVGDVARRQAIVDFSTGRRLPAYWSQGIARDSLGHHSQAFAAYLSEWAGSREAPAGLRLPVGVAVGEHDPSITQELFFRTWKLAYPQASCMVVQNAGHYPMQEVPAASAALFERWVSQHLATTEPSGSG